MTQETMTVARITLSGDTEIACRGALYGYWEVCPLDSLNVGHSTSVSLVVDTYRL